MPLTRDQQVAYLRRFGEVWPLKSIAIALGAIAAACVYLFSQSTQEQLRVVALFVAGVSGLVAVAIAMDLPGWKRAARATRTGRRVKGFIKLTVDRSDPESPTIVGRMKCGNAIWDLQFSKPIGWEPDSGDWPCEMVLLSGEPTPALVELEDGLLVPTRRSRRQLGGA